MELIHKMTRPRHGPVTPIQTHESTQTASVNGYDILIFAGFSVDPEAQAFIQKAPIKSRTVHFANVNPHVLVGDLLKTGRASPALHTETSRCPSHPKRFLPAKRGRKTFPHEIGPSFLGHRLPGQLVTV